MSDDKTTVDLSADGDLECDFVLEEDEMLKITMGRLEVTMSKDQWDRYKMRMMGKMK